MADEPDRTDDIDQAIEAARPTKVDQALDAVLRVHEAGLEAVANSMPSGPGGMAKAYVTGAAKEAVGSRDKEFARAKDEAIDDYASRVFPLERKASELEDRMNDLARQVEAIASTGFSERIHGLSAELVALAARGVFDA